MHTCIHIIYLFQAINEKIMYCRFFFFSRVYCLLKVFLEAYFFCCR